MEVSEVSNRALAELLGAQTGQELTPNRLWRIKTVLSGLLREYGVDTADQLIAKLASSRQSTLARKVVEALLNNETYFFRDRAMFDILSQKVLPDLARRREQERRLSIWCVGCSTGQEPLSMAMMFADNEAKWAGWNIEILGTDVSHSVIETARAGKYTQFEAQRGLAIGQMIKWFDEVPDGWQAQDRLRQMVRFEVHNLLEPRPAPGNFDLVLCRNVLLYFDTPTRKRAFDRLANVMSPDGWLMLGAGETVIGQTERFAADRGLPGLYRCPAPGALPKPARPRRPVGSQLTASGRLGQERRKAAPTFIKNASS
ncbi:MAG: protein-glutamate O-methyltransferase CheR [Novosphingobium sp.]